MGRRKTKQTLEELTKQTDSWKNNRFADFPYRTMINLPQPLKNFMRDKDTNLDAADRLLSIPGHKKNKRRRRRDVIEHPDNVIGPK